MYFPLISVHYSGIFDETKPKHTKANPYTFHGVALLPASRQECVSALPKQHHESNIGQNQVRVLLEYIFIVFVIIYV